MDRAELLYGIGNFYGNLTRSLWTYPVLPIPSNLWKLSTTPRICLQWINEPTQNRHKIHLKQSRKHRNRKQSVKFWPVHSLHNTPQRQTVPYSPQRHRQLQSKHHSSSIAHQMNPSEMRTSLCWTKISCPTPFLLDHPTRSPDVVINLLKLGYPTSHL